jgi:putative protein-disulfide isomerase
MKMFYFTDAMCSWCYGFSPVVKKLRENYPDIDLQIISGGYSPGNREVVTDRFKDFLQYHWRNVNLRSGQPFDYSKKFITEAFRYDTEPSSRALTVIQKLLPNQDFEFLSLMQRSFYAEGKDITNETVLVGLAEEMGIKREVFLENFNSQELKRKTVQGFQFSRQLGVQGFPTLLTLENGVVKIITRGFQTYDSLAVIIDDWFRQILASDLTSGPSCADGSCGN